MRNPFKKLLKNGAEAKTRELPAIQQEAANVYAQYGAKQYTILALKEEASTLFKQLKDLNHEAYAAQQVAATKPVVADTQPVDVVAQT